MSNSAPPPSIQSTETRRSSSWPLKFLIVSLVGPISIAIVLYQLDSFDPAVLPPHELTQNVVAVPKRNSRMLQGSEYLGQGKLLAVEDIAYDPESRLIYTGSSDGWVKRATVNDSVADSIIENWVHTGGRPLGLAFGRNHDLIVADTEKGLLKVSKDGEVELLTNEAEGLRFKLTDGVDVAENGMIYFTDASYKYGFDNFIFDFFELRPHGRLMSYDPITKKTKVLVRDLYFANGISVSPDQNYVIFCETPMRRCRKYWIRGEKEGSVEKFVDDLPGFPDNIRYDGDGHYWIGVSSGFTASWNLALKHAVIRKVMAMLENYKLRPEMLENGGVISVSLEGEPIAYYYDKALSLISSGAKIGNHLYCGSIQYPYIIRLNLNHHAAA